MSATRTLAQAIPPPLERRGGALVGCMNASWPLAKLRVSPAELTLKITLLGTYTFRPDQIVRFEAKKLLRSIEVGMRIHHVVPDYPRKIIFGARGGTERLLQEIQAAGFTPCAPARQLARFQGWPFKPLTLLVGVMFLVLLSVAVLLEGFLRKAHGSTAEGPGVSVLVALLLVFLGCLGLRWLRPVQRLLLKPERSIGEIRPIVSLFTILSGVLLVALVIATLVQLLH